MRLVIAFVLVGCGQVDAAERVLKVTTSGAGGGHVTSPDGINCGTSCETTVELGTVLTLAPSAEASSVFEGWSGAICSGDTDCMVTVNDDTTVDAKFEI